MLFYVQDRLEAHHKCVYAPAALSAAVALSSRYIADRFQPDKALDLVDEAGSRARIRAHNARRSLDISAACAAERLSELQEVMAAKREAIQVGFALSVPVRGASLECRRNKTTHSAASGEGRAFSEPFVRL